jgi:glycine/D-amino acid oxidase-like deaminating enzyme
MSRKPEINQKKLKNAVVIGAGFCGLAMCYNLLLNGWHVTVYDKKPIGGGASGIAAGLIHPFAGEAALKSLEADAGMLASNKLFSIAELALGKSIRTRGGVIRPALNPTQAQDYAKCAVKYPEQVQWNGKELWIPEGFAVDTYMYLQGLWKACENLGAKFHQKEMKPEIKADLVVWATGADMRDCVDVEVTKVRGQLLEVQWPKDVEPLKLPISSKIYAVMKPDGTSCYVGSTYERHRLDDIPDIEYAAREILPKIYPILPFLEGMPILGCRAGVRASTPGHRPLIKQVGENVFVIGGMGSKGLLYHALYAEKLMENNFL